MSVHSPGMRACTLVTGIRARRARLGANFGGRSRARHLFSPAFARHLAWGSDATAFGLPHRNDAAVVGGDVLLSCRRSFEHARQRQRDSPLCPCQRKAESFLIHQEGVGAGANVMDLLILSAGDLSWGQDILVAERWPPVQINNAHLIHDHSTGRSSTRLHAPPGGGNSMGTSFGWSDEPVQVLSLSASDAFLCLT